MKKFILLFLLMTTSVFALDVEISDYDPLPAEAGKPVNVWFKVNNPDDFTVSGFDILVVPKDGLSFTSGEQAQRPLGLFEELSSQTVRYRLLVDDNAFEGSHVVEVRLIKDELVIKKELSIEVTDKDFKDVDLSIGDVDSDPTRIKPGDDDIKIDVMIQNLGDGSARGVRAELMGLPDGMTLTDSYSGSSLVGNIPADGSGVATFYFDVDESVKSGEYSADLDLSYKYKPDEEEEDYLLEDVTLNLKLAIKPVPLYEITKVWQVPAEITAGDREVILTLTVKNVGEETGESVRLKAYGKTEQPLTFDKSSDFIAPSLDPGEEGQATLELKVDDDAALQKYFLDLEIKNIVDEDVLTYDKKVALEVKHAKPDNPWGLVVIGIVIMFIIIVVLIVRGARNRKKRKARKATRKGILED